MALCSRYFGVSVWVRYKLTKKWEIGTNKVAVPTHYFKIVIDVKSGGSVKSIAFLIPHKKMTKPYTRYLVSIDRIEGVTRV